MKKKEIAFSVIFLVLSYYLIGNSSFLSFHDIGDMILFIMLIIGSLYLTVFSLLELIQLKKMKFKNRIINLFSFFSSLVFLLASIYALIN